MDGSVANTTTDVPSVRAGAFGGAKWQGRKFSSVFAVRNCIEN